MPLNLSASFESYQDILNLTKSLQIHLQALIFNKNPSKFPGSLEIEQKAFKFVCKLTNLTKGFPFCLRASKFYKKLSILSSKSREGLQIRPKASKFNEKPPNSYKFNENPKN